MSVYSSSCTPENFRYLHPEPAAVSVLLPVRTRSRSSPTETHEEILQRRNLEIQLFNLQGQVADAQARLDTLRAAEKTEAIERQHLDASTALEIRECAANEQERRDEITRLTCLESAAVARARLGRARSSRLERRCAKTSPARAEELRHKVQDRLAEVLFEADQVIDFPPEFAIAGVRRLPACAFPEPVPMPALHSRVVGATGLCACIPWEIPTAIPMLEALFSSLRPIRAGAWRHVGHAVLSKPNDGAAAVQTWSTSTAVRAARHYLVGIGADPDRHPATFFVHSQVARTSTGRTKVEEAVHILWSRVRDDGLIHVLDHAFVAAVLARARYDTHAGIDPARIAMTASRHKLIEDGMHAVYERSLSATYRRTDARVTVERVPLLGASHLRRIANEGFPEPGDIAGTWVPKPGYGSPQSIRAIIQHLVKGD